MKKLKLLIFWPGYNSEQFLFFQTLLNNFDCIIIFVSNWRNSNQYLELNSKRVDQWNFRSTRIRYFNLFSFCLLFIKQVKVIIEFKPDLIITSTQSPLHSKFAYVISKLLGTKIAIYTEAWYFPAYTNLLQKIHQKIKFHLLKNADYCLVQGIKKMEAYNKLGVDKKKIKIMPFLINIPKVDNMTPKKIMGKKIYFFMGRFIPVKGIDVLVKAFVKLYAKYSDVELVLAGDVLGDSKNFGDGSLFETYDLIESEKLKGKVKRVGWLDSVGKNFWFSESSFFILPSKKIGNVVEGWGLVLQEALSHGLPVITTDAVGSASDFVVNNENGFVVKNGDINELFIAMNRLYLLSENQYNKFAATSRDIFEKYNDPNRVIAVTKEMLN